MESDDNEDSDDSDNVEVKKQPVLPPKSTPPPQKAEPKKDVPLLPTPV